MVRFVLNWDIVHSSMVIISRTEIDKYVLCISYTIRDYQINIHYLDGFRQTLAHGHDNGMGKQRAFERTD